MKLGFCVVLLSLLTFDAMAQSGVSGQKTGGVEACLAKCSSDDSSCRRACPITFSGPCLSSCDNRTQSCQQTCQSR
jgi:hypothetical protein